MCDRARVVAAVVVVAVVFFVAIRYLAARNQSLHSLFVALVLRVVMVMSVAASMFGDAHVGCAFSEQEPKRKNGVLCSPKA